MGTEKRVPQTIDEYIAGFPPDVQKTLEAIRGAIRQAAPELEETISYGMPTFDLKGRHVVFFAAYSSHVGFYPAPREAEAFKEALSAYKGGKGTIRFPLNRPLPFDLIRDIVHYRVQEVAAEISAKSKGDSGQR